MLPSGWMQSLTSCSYSLGSPHSFPPTEQETFFAVIVAPAF